jgi:hypothetical protein
MGDRLAGKTRREIKIVLKLNAPQDMSTFNTSGPQLGDMGISFGSRQGS